MFWYIAAKLLKEVAEFVEEAVEFVEEEIDEYVEETAEFVEEAVEFVEEEIDEYVEETAEFVEEAAEFVEEAVDELVEELFEEKEKEEEEYDIFLSFNGKDTRKGFTDHLYIQLKDSGFSVFKDDVNLPVGEEIAVSLPEAIKRSKIVMPIFSENYAASKWCMKELVYMMECRKTISLKVVPIFCRVTPHQVRHQTGSYGTAFLEHSKKYDFGTIQEWKEALAEVGSIKGLELATETCGCEGQFTKLIVAKVSKELNRADLLVLRILDRMFD